MRGDVAFILAIILIALLAFATSGCEADDRNWSYDEAGAFNIRIRNESKMPYVPDMSWYEDTYVGVSDCLGLDSTPVGPLIVLVDGLLPHPDPDKHPTNGVYDSLIAWVNMDQTGWRRTTRHEMIHHMFYVITADPDSDHTSHLWGCQYATP